MAKATVDRPAGSDDASEPRRLTAQGLERKQQLLDSAAELFAERGYADTRVLDIVRHAGVAKGLFYWYFENKEALFRELVDPPPPGAPQGAGQRDGPGGRAAAPHPPGRRGLDRHHVVQRATSSPCSRSRTRSERFADLLRRGNEIHMADTVRLVQAGIADGIDPRRGPGAARLGVVGAVAYYGHFHRTRRADLPVAELAAFVGRYVVRALAADEEIAVRVLRA